jgi:hypothetical protein
MKTLVAVLLFAASAFSQIPTTVENTTGLSVVNATTTFNGKEGVTTATVRNDSAKPIRYFAIVVNIDTGQKGIQPLISLCEPSLSTTKDIMPGESRNWPVELASDVAVANVTWTVDFVKFADGSFEGPRKSDGARLVFVDSTAKTSLKMALARLYREKGLNALLLEIGISAP